MEGDRMPCLLAEQQIAESVQTGVAMAVIATLSTIAGSLIGWLKERDQLRYNRDLAELKATNALQTVQIASLTKMQLECEAKNEAQEKRIIELEGVVARLVAQNRATSKSSEPAPIPV